MLFHVARRLSRGWWGWLRLFAAATVLWIVLADHGARSARLLLSRLPDFDFAREVQTLRDQGRYGEAIAIADAGMETSLDAAMRECIALERETTLGVRGSWARRLKDIAAGAITGSAAGPETSIEALAGAIVVDFFVVGDIRDLVIQGSRYVRGNETDPVILALSGVGLATTLAPEIDWAPSVLKLARRTGALTERLGAWILGAAKVGDTKGLRTLFVESAEISKHASPAGASRLLRYVDSPEDAAMLAGFLSRTTKRGAGALHATGDAGAEMLRRAESLRTLGKADDALRIERVVLEAGAKGERGRAWLKSGAARSLIKPHALVGALKGVYKGHAAAVLERFLASLDPFGWWLVPALTSWVVLEVLLSLRRITRGRRRRPEVQKQRDRR